MCYALFACAFNLLLGFTGLLSFGHAAFLGSAATPAMRSGMGPAHRAGPAVRRGRGRLLGLAMGALAIRRSGIYFAMITLALAQMVFFFFLQASSPAARTGCKACRAAPCWACWICPGPEPVLRGDGHLHHRLLIMAHGALALRPGAAGRTSRVRSRWAMTWTASSCWPSCCRPPSPAWPATKTGVRVGDAVRRHLADVGPGHPDDADRRAGHADRPDPGRLHRRAAGEQGRRLRPGPGQADRRGLVPAPGRVGHHRDRPDLRDLRAGVPSRHRGRAGGVCRTPPRARAPDAVRHFVRNRGRESRPFYRGNHPCNPPAGRAARPGRAVSCILTIRRGKRP